MKKTKEFNKMETTILSVQNNQFKQADGSFQTMYKVFLADDTGAVGCVYSKKPHCAGEVVSLVISVGRDGRFTAKILE